MNETLHNKEFLDFQIKLIEKMFEVEFTGSTHKDKHEFYKEHKEAVRHEIDYTLKIMSIAQTSKVFHFKADYVSEYIVANNREEALNLFAEALNIAGISVPEGLTVTEKDIHDDYVWVNKNFVPDFDLNIFEEDDDTVKVPFIYAVSYALNHNYQEMPFFI